MKKTTNHGKKVDEVGFHLYQGGIPPMKPVVLELDAQTHDALKMRAVRNRREIPQQLLSEALNYARASHSLREKKWEASKEDGIIGRSRPFPD